MAEVNDVLMGAETGIAASAGCGNGNVRPIRPSRSSVESW